MNIDRKYNLDRLMGIIRNEISTRLISLTSEYTKNTQLNCALLHRCFVMLISDLKNAQLEAMPRRPCGTGREHP